MVLILRCGRSGSTEVWKVKTSSVITTAMRQCNVEPTIRNESGRPISSSSSLDLIANLCHSWPIFPISLLHNQQISQLNSFCLECACNKFVCNFVDSDDSTVSFIWHIYFNNLWNWKIVGLLQSSDNALLAPVQDTPQTQRPSPLDYDIYCRKEHISSRK